MGFLIKERGDSNGDVYLQSGVPPTWTADPKKAQRFANLSAALKKRDELRNSGLYGELRTVNLDAPEKSNFYKGAAKKPTEAENARVLTGRQLKKVAKAKKGGQ